ncbi:MAG: outer membrane beta-barrel protein [Ginsengibacter sp.]
MNRKFFFHFILLLCVCNAEAQKGNNQVTVIAEGTVPVYQNDQGFGGFIKGLYGIGKSAHLTFTAGVSEFTSKKNVELSKTTTRLIPFMAGYKQNLNKFFVEPQIGFGELGGKIFSDGDYARPSIGALFWAFGAGYNFNRIVIGVRFESVHGVEGSSSGLWHNQNFHYTGIQVGYNIFQKK